MDIIISSRTLSGVELLPNLRHLSSEDTLFIQKWIPVFINKSLSTLDLEASEADMHLLTRTLSHLHHLCPKLRSLTLATGKELDDALQFDTALSSLLLLNDIDLSPTLLCLSTINTIAHLPHLEYFRITVIDPGEESTLPAVPLPAFPSLTSFTSETIGFCDVVSFLEAYEPRRLQILNVHSASTESYATYQSFFSAVASACPDIKGIYLKSSLAGDNESISQHSSIPLLIPYHLWDLTSLELITPPPLKLDVDSMKTLLTALPSLRVLTLADEAGAPTLPLSALAELAPLCPAMISLALCLSTRNIAASAPSNTIFPRLKVLNLLSSPLESSAQDVATFLASVLPPTCAVRHFIGWAELEAPKWKQVIDFVQSIFKLRLAQQVSSAVTPPDE